MAQNEDYIEFEKDQLLTEWKDPEVLINRVGNKSIKVSCYYPFENLIHARFPDQDLQLRYNYKGSYIYINVPLKLRKKYEAIDEGDLVDFYFEFSEDKKRLIMKSFKITDIYKLRTAKEFNFDEYRKDYRNDPEGVENKYKNTKYSVRAKIISVPSKASSSGLVYTIREGTTNITCVFDPLMENELRHYRKGRIVSLTGFYRGGYLRFHNCQRKLWYLFRAFPLF